MRDRVSIYFIEVVIIPAKADEADAEAHEADAEADEANKAIVAD